MKYVLHGIMYLIGALFTYIAVVTVLYMSRSGSDMIFFKTFFPISAPIILVFNLITRKRILKNYDLEHDGLLDDLDIDPSKEVQFPKLRAIDIILGVLVIISGLVATAYLLIALAPKIFNRGYTQGDDIFVFSFLLFGTGVLIYYPIHVFNAHKGLRKKTVNDI